MPTSMTPHDYQHTEANTHCQQSSLDEVFWQSASVEGRHLGALVTAAFRMPRWSIHWMKSSSPGMGFSWDAAGAHPRCTERLTMHSAVPCPSACEAEQEVTQASDVRTALGAATSARAVSVTQPVRGLSYGLIAMKDVGRKHNSP